METVKLKNFSQYARKALREFINNKLEHVIAQESAARREQPRAVKELEKQVNIKGKEQVVEKVAYIWFNRFCALRFMDVNHYNRVGVLSPLEGQFQPEILAEAKMGEMDEIMIPTAVQKKISDLLNNKTPSQDPENEAYRLIVVAVCNYWNKTMSFLFERIDDYTELLMPDDLLSGNSIVAYTREAMPPAVCRDVEVIGWLYQFYISEKKDEVFAGLKKNKKITPENIPAATQLFTPNWIVRYLVENSLGRLWMLNNPGSKLIDRMDYYIKPEQDETDFLVIKSPEEIKICDPACGSGHMLVYAFEILYGIYEEEGYDTPTIPQIILENNLYGIEIDERAGELAAFALFMKAREKYRRFFKKSVQPNICVLENISFEPSEVKSYMDAVDPDLFTMDLQTLLYQFKEADNFGSLIRPALTSIPDILRLLDDKKITEDIFLQDIHKRVLKVLKQADYLSPKYHVVIANPPYMGGKGMNARLGKWLKDEYPAVKSDLFSAFMVRNAELGLPRGQLGFMSLYVWMFISSYEKLRSLLINQKTITSLIQLEYSGFDGATVPICTFTVENIHKPDFQGGYIKLSDFKGTKNQAPKTLEAIKNLDCGWFFRASASDFKNIPGYPIAYWISEKIRDLFEYRDRLSLYSDIKTGMQTGNNERFLRLWHEVAINKINSLGGSLDTKRWNYYSKGGDFSKWYGNVEHIVDWNNDGYEIKNLIVNGVLRSRVRELSNYFKKSASWSFISSAYFGCRYKAPGIFFDVAGSCALEKNVPIEDILGFMCSKLSTIFLSGLNPTLNFQIQDISNLPYAPVQHEKNTISDLISLSKNDWDSHETSWDFKELPLLKSNHQQFKLKDSYSQLFSNWTEIVKEMQNLEQKNNSIFIEAYGLEDELTPVVPLSEITLTFNPHYRYPDNSRKIYTDQERDAMLLADTIKEFISYSAGCMFGRYSLDKPGLILANQEETLEDYLAKIPEPSFEPDDDNVIPITDVDWFEDDIVERFKHFLKVTFGQENYAENLTFIEDAIGKDIRKYFLKEFYTFHVKMYKKRPIYWMFSSPKGSFNALIYMHRYRHDTVSVVLNDYLREFRTKLSARKDNFENISISASASQREKTKALKEIEKIKKVLEEINVYEKDILYPLATKQIEIDLDDGVKVNYPKFGKALKKVAGLS